MQKGLSETLKKILMILIGVVVLIICYTLLYQKFTEQKAAAEASRAALEPTLQDYRDCAAHMEEYRTKIAQDKTVISNTLKRLPSEVKYEDMILYTDAMAIESNVGLDESSISFTDPMLFLEFNGVTSEDVDNASKAVPMKAYRSSFSVESTMNYQALKKLMELCTYHGITFNLQMNTGAVPPIQKENKEKIEKLLREELKNDRAKTQVEGFTKLNLMEMTRKHICSHLDE